MSNRYVIEEEIEYVPETNMTYTTQTIRKLPKRSTALFLCLFFGLFGLHRIYVGRVGSGILMFLTGGFFCLGWIGDIGMLILGEFKDKDGRIVK